MKLPGAERAVVDIRKLRDYCFDLTNPKGGGKARVFAVSLGVTHEDAEFLQQALLNAAADNVCAAGEADEFGQRYTLDFMLRTAHGKRRVRSGWMVRHGENFPRLTTCFVIKSSASET